MIARLADVGSEGAALQSCIDSCPCGFLAGLGLARVVAAAHATEHAGTCARFEVHGALPSEIAACAVRLWAVDAHHVR
jgi:hypothetical protein